VSYPVETVREIAKRHGLIGEPRLLPNSGMVNEAWQIGDDYVLRIIVQDDCDEEAKRESLVVPLVIAAGVRSPELVAFDLECKLTPRPYTVYRRAAGDLLGHLEEDPASFEASYHEIGREIRLLNGTAVTDELKAVLREARGFEAHKGLQKARDEGVLTEQESGDLELWLATLESLFGHDSEPCFLHRDIHPWNVFVEASTRELTAIIDWGDAAFGDPSIEFASMPMVALPAMFAGYSEAGGKVDQALVARALHLGIGLALWEIRELDPARFDRRWWRFPLGGWPEVWRTCEDVLAEYPHAPHAHSAAR
jgi:hygromycin-B 7''-O-kinase